MNNLSTADDPNGAQVLIITQQRLELVCGDKSLCDVASLMFHGKARTLRIWDESFLPAQPITVTTDDLAAVLGWLRPKSAVFHGWVEGVRAEANKADDGQVIAVPTTDFFDEQITLNQALAPLRKMRGQGSDILRDRDDATLISLWAMRGRWVTVRQDGRFGTTLVSFRKTLPDDLLPLVVLDASARVRGTYSLMAQLMLLKRLPPATKQYDGLRINVWERGGGKSSFQDKKVFQNIVEALGTLIGAGSSYQKWLVVTHKPGGEMPDLKGALTRRLATVQDDVSFLTWGQHSATNDHADTDHAILAGTLFYWPSFYEALGRASTLKDPNELTFSPDEVKSLELGEHAHMVLQALCRASIRKTSSGVSSTCEAFLIASSQSRIPSLLTDWFPGCTVVPWEPKGPKHTRHSQHVLDFLTTWSASAAHGATIRFSEVYKTLDINLDVFRKSVRGNPALTDALTALGIREDGPGANRTRYAYEATSGSFS